MSPCLPTVEPGFFMRSPWAARWFSRRFFDESTTLECRAFATIGLFESMCATEGHVVRCALDELPAGARDVAVLLERDRRDAIRERIAQQSKRVVSDLNPAPPLVSASAVPGYYTIHVGRRTADVFVVVVVTVILTVLTANAESLVGVSMASWMQLVPVGVGTLAAVIGIIRDVPDRGGAA